MDIASLIFIGSIGILIRILYRRIKQARLAMFALGFDSIVLRETLDYARELLVAENGESAGENLEKYYKIATARHTEELAQEEKRNK